MFFISDKISLISIFDEVNCVVTFFRFRTFHCFASYDK